MNKFIGIAGAIINLNNVEMIEFKGYQIIFSFTSGDDYSFSCQNDEQLNDMRDELKEFING